MKDASSSSTPPAAPTSTRLRFLTRSTAARSAPPVWTSMPTSPRPTLRSTPTRWSPARRTSAPRPSRLRAASAKSWSRSSPRCNLSLTRMTKRKSRRKTALSFCPRARHGISPRSFHRIHQQNCAEVYDMERNQNYVELWGVAAGGPSFRTRTIPAGSTNFPAGRAPVGPERRARHRGE